ncbi:DNA polymerase III subunit epsilon [Dokdonella sp.]|uniref:DNA polymerase III subunit epsilon n=1 Tax=Dokdonella sp. TaxID=2291710 RepID=UPI003C6A7497
MRQVVLDTETTGLEVKKGHRVIEIGCVELLERRPSGRTFHCFLNPDRAVDEGARAVHGIDDAFLQDKPRFREITSEFLDFVAGAEIIAHNASFDVGFLDAELGLAAPELGKLTDHASVLDSLQMAREKYPGQQNSLNALCKRLGVDNRHRELHGALVDAHLLADVYLAMTAGQGDLGLAVETAEQPQRAVTTGPLAGHGLRVLRANESELAAHAARIESIEVASQGACVWKISSKEGDERVA